MGTITISISDEAESKFREAVKLKMGTGKGKIGKAVEEAISRWTEEDEEKELVKRALEKLDKGLYKVGKNYTFKREEAYDERLRKQGSAD